MIGDLCEDFFEPDDSDALTGSQEIPQQRQKALLPFIASNEHPVVATDD
jgi:hypothetical protein